MKEFDADFCWYKHPYYLIFYYIHNISSRRKKQNCFLPSHHGCVYMYLLIHGITFCIEQSTENFFSLAIPPGLQFFLCYCPHLCFSLGANMSERQNTRHFSTFLSLPGEIVGSFWLRMSRKEKGWSFDPHLACYPIPDPSVQINTCSSTHHWPRPLIVSQKVIYFQLCSKHGNDPYLIHRCPEQKSHNNCESLCWCAGKTQSHNFKIVGISKGNKKISKLPGKTYCWL